MNTKSISTDINLVPESQLSLLLKSKSKELLQLISSQNKRIMTIESMTGGSIINSLTNVPGYSDTIYGGLIVYNNNAKTKMLGEFNISVYSTEYAEQMCTNALNIHSKYADIAISITGNTNPTDSNNNDYSSVFYIAIGIKNNNEEQYKIISKKVILDSEYINNYTVNCQDRREIVKIIAVKKVLSFSLKVLNE